MTHTELYAHLVEDLKSGKITTNMALTQLERIIDKYIIDYDHLKFENVEISYANPELIDKVLLKKRLDKLIINWRKRLDEFIQGLCDYINDYTEPTGYGKVEKYQLYKTFTIKSVIYTPSDRDDNCVFGIELDSGLTDFDYDFSYIIEVRIYDDRD